MDIPRRQDMTKQTTVTADEFLHQLRGHTSQIYGFAVMLCRYPSGIAQSVILTRLVAGRPGDRGSIPLRG